jgi:hypothetical protein
MISCITLKNNTFKQFKIKNVDEENIYKKCGYKSPNNFNKLYTWTIDASTQLELWSKQDSASKVYNQHSIFLKYAINVNSNNKCIFLLKSNNNYNNLDGKYFNEFFGLKEVIETETISNTNDANTNDANTNDANTNTINTNANTNATNATNANDAKTFKNLDKNLDKNEDIDVNSELSYELYSYSDEETDIV